MTVSLFEALFTLLIEEGPAVQADAVLAVVADPQIMAERVALTRAQIEEEMEHVKLDDDSFDLMALVDQITSDNSHAFVPMGKPVGAEHGALAAEQHPADAAGNQALPGFPSES